jgi:uncharacterized linocin/CFP29 family protein
MENSAATPATVDSWRQFQNGSSGLWAGMRMLAAIASGQQLVPGILRTNDTLRKDQWIAFDRAIVEGAAPRLRAVADLIAAGLTTPVANSMGKTIYQYDKIGDMDPAVVSMDGMARSENDRLEYTFGQLPIPIIHKDFFLNLRLLSASRNGGEGLDVTQARVAGRKCGEESERMLVLGGKTFGGLPIYGYLTHPNRNTVAFGTNGNWVQAAKTGENILADVQTAISIAEGDSFYGPYWLYVSRNAASKLEGDYKAATSTTVRQRIEELDSISSVRYLDQLPANNVVLVQPTSDVVTLLNGENLQTVQWDVNGGFGINFKAFMIQVPLIRADSQNRSGIVHMS